MAGRPRRRGFFSDDFFEEFGNLQDLMENMMKEFTEEGLEHPRENKPIVYGVNIRIGPDGKPQVSQFGNVAKGKVAEEREPLVDVIEESAEVRAVIELPGVSKDSIKLNITENTLSVNVTHPERRFAKTIKLPAKVEEKSAKATYKNGILEVVLRKKEPSQAKPGKEITVG
jgi:HSP20 family protein